jgi:hypothetical protein
MPGFHIGTDRDIPHGPANFGDGMRDWRLMPPLTEGYDAIYTYTWDVSQIPFDVSTASNQQTMNMDMLRKVYLRDCTLPEYTIDEEIYQSPSTKYKYAKGITWSDVKITYYDTFGLYLYLDNLKSKVWTPAYGVKPAVEYKFESVINVYIADAIEAFRWTLVNSWVKSISWADLTYVSSDMHMVTITLAYDWAILTGDNGIPSATPATALTPVVVPPMAIPPRTRQVPTMF